MALSRVTPSILESQLKGLSHARTRAGAVATLLVLLPRLEDEHAPLLLPYIDTLASLLADGAGNDDAETAGIQANAAAVLGAAASMTDELHAAVDTAAAESLARLVEACGGAAAASTTATGAEAASSEAKAATAAEGADEDSGGDALSINVLSAVAQLAREPGPTLEAASTPDVLTALLACASPACAPPVTEAALDALCAVASNAPTRSALRAAGAVPAAAAAVASTPHAECAVRALMLLGMLCSGGGGSADGEAAAAASLQQLVHAEDGRAVVRLLALAKQSSDLDCKVIARDLLGLLTRNSELRAGVEAAVRRAAAEVAGAAAAASGAPGGTAA